MQQDVQKECKTVFANVFLFFKINTSNLKPQVRLQLMITLDNDDSVDYFSNQSNDHLVYKVLENVKLFCLINRTQRYSINEDMKLKK